MTDPASFRAGDERLFRELVREESGRLLRIIRAFAQDDDEADDLLQQTWLAVYRSRGQFDGRGSLAGWMMAVCRNVCLAHARRRDARPALVPVANRMAAVDEGRPIDLAGALHLAIAELAPRERDVVMLRLVEGLATRETAERMGCAEGTVKATLHRATMKLRELLRDYR